ncbi:uncharacterized protein isoform X2 [Choristoneura fumiferana]|uniref:uncharacterized protein isoform X2 n=1 Tax=Choristoneura fumiferana TaxID=7141 RepID=UPI003D15C246
MMSLTFSVLHPLPNDFPLWLHGLYLFWETGRLLLAICGIIVTIGSAMLIFATNYPEEYLWMTLAWFPATVLDVIFSISVSIYTIMKTEDMFLIVGPIFMVCLHSYCALVVLSWYMENKA